MIEKLKRDGKVAVLYSPGFGAGWSTWSDEKEEMVFCYELAELILSIGNTASTYKRLEEVARRLFPKAYLGGLGDLEIEWVPEGYAFCIEEYDGSESVSIVDESYYMIA